MKVTMVLSVSRASVVVGVWKRRERHFSSLLMLRLLLLHRLVGAEEMVSMVLRVFRAAVAVVVWRRGYHFTSFRDWSFSA